MIDLIQQHRAEIESLCRKFGVKRLDVFGSAATGEFDPATSDVDFLVEYQPETDLGPWLKDYFELKEALEAVLAKPVDLVMATEFRNPYFRASVQKSRQLLYAA